MNDEIIIDIQFIVAYTCDPDWIRIHMFKSASRLLASPQQ